MFNCLLCLYLISLYEVLITFLYAFFFLNFRWNSFVWWFVFVLVSGVCVCMRVRPSVCETLMVLVGVIVKIIQFVKCLFNIPYQTFYDCHLCLSTRKGKHISGDNTVGWKWNILELNIFIDLKINIFYKIPLTYFMIERITLIFQRNFHYAPLLSRIKYQFIC